MVQQCCVFLARFPFQLTRRTSRETQHFSDWLVSILQLNKMSPNVDFHFISTVSRFWLSLEYSVCTCLSDAGYKVIFKGEKFGRLEILWS